MHGFVGKRGYKILFLIFIFCGFNLKIHAQDRMLAWKFPLSSPFEGVQVGNGTQKD